MPEAFRLSIGEITITAIQDTSTRVPATNMVRPDLEADMASYAHLLAEDGTVELSMTTFVLDSQGRRIMVDSCLADQPMPRSELAHPPRLPGALEEAGIALESIDVVVHTHLHFDHVGWNTREREGRLEPTFPNARHVVQRVEWGFWRTHPEQAHGPDFARHFEPLETSGQVELIDEDGHELTDEVSVIFARGHTPGHQAVRIESGGERGYVIGDACHVPPQACEPSWSSGADIDPDEAATTRTRLFQRIEDEGALLLSGHFPFPGIGRRVTRADRKDWVPLEGS